VVSWADRRAQVALVWGDGGVDGRGNESARLGGNDQGLRPRPLLWLPHRRLSLQLDIQVLSLEKKTEQRWLRLPCLRKTKVLTTAWQCHLWNCLPTTPTTARLKGGAVQKPFSLLSLRQRSANFFCRGPESKYFRLCGTHVVSVTYFFAFFFKKKKKIL
jgi:hypothetical protein